MALDGLMLGVEGGAPVISEVSALLDQCSPEELENILAAIEGGDDSALLAACQAEGEDFAKPLSLQEEPIEKAATAPALEPVRPAAPPPPGNGKRPVPAGVKRVPEGESVTVDDMQKMLDDQGAALMSEVRKMMNPAQSSPSNMDMEALTMLLSQRDQEVQGLEAYLADLQGQLSTKDKRVQALGSELDMAVREVRHRQLDLEFQQLKLEERVRCNADLEQAQRALVDRVEEASLQARHHALEADMTRSPPLQRGLSHNQASHGLFFSSSD